MGGKMPPNDSCRRTRVKLSRPLHAQGSRHLAVPLSLVVRQHDHRVINGFCILDRLQVQRGYSRFSTGIRGVAIASLISVLAVVFLTRGVAESMAAGVGTSCKDFYRVQCN